MIHAKENMDLSCLNFYEGVVKTMMDKTEEHKIEMVRFTLGFLFCFWKYIVQNLIAVALGNHAICTCTGACLFQIFKIIWKVGTWKLSTRIWKMESRLPCAQNSPSIIILLVQTMIVLVIEIIDQWLMILVMIYFFLPPPSSSSSRKYWTRTRSRGVIINQLLIKDRCQVRRRKMNKYKANTQHKYITFIYYCIQRDYLHMSMYSIWYYDLPTCAYTYTWGQCVSPNLKPHNMYAGFWSRKTWYAFWNKEKRRWHVDFWRVYLLNRSQKVFFGHP